jgi:molybdenum cofactor cytidylyltransferase
VLSGVVLAAGYSTRMGSPKALLPTRDGQPFVVRIIRTLRSAGVRDIVVVTGQDHDAVVDVIARFECDASIRAVRNPDPGRGQLSSLLEGMAAAVQPATEALLVTLVDVPLVEVSTVTSVISAWQRTRALIVRPAIGERHGHPVIFDRRLFDELRRAPLDAGAKSVVRAQEAEILNVPVDDEGCMQDIDTREDYKAVLTETTEVTERKQHGATEPRRH